MTAARHRLLAAAVPALVLLGTGTVASAADSPAGCGPTVVSSRPVSGQTELLVTAPPQPGRTAPGAGAFHLVQDGTARPVAVQPVPARDLAVAVVVASSARTSAADLQSAREGALELLVGLAPQARTAVLSTARTEPLAPLSADRARSTESLRLLKAGAVGSDGSDAATVVRAAAGLPRGGHVVLLSDGTGGTDGTAGTDRATTDRLRSSGVVLDRVTYGVAARTAAAGAASCPSPQEPVLRQVDQVVAAVDHQYVLRAGLDPARPATLAVDGAGGPATVEVPAASATAGSVQAADGTTLYSAPRVSALTADSAYALAAVLGLLGLALLVRGGRRGAQDEVGPEPYADDERLRPVAAAGR